MRRSTTRPTPGAVALAALAALTVSCSGGGGSGTALDDRTAAHLLRRAGFGPSPDDLARVRSMGLERWVDEQLDPASIDDAEAEERFDEPIGPEEEDLLPVVAGWTTRMVYSRRQLQEKMTLVWHELFSVSTEKVPPVTMQRHFELLRTHALGDFRELLVEVTIDPAMLLWLDNAFNEGQARDEEGRRLPPNENYARELLQLFTLGTDQLRMDGTPILDPDGRPLPTYTERDVREIARALTGWFLIEAIDDVPADEPAFFFPLAHDPGSKEIFGVTVPGQTSDGRAEVEAVVDRIMAQPSLAPFLAEQLIQKLATETPDPAYVERVATVFAETDGDIAATVRAILLDPEFTAPANVRSQIKEPIEQFVGLARALDADTTGILPFFAALESGQGLGLPPSVFSFYRPGRKVTLITAGRVLIRDQLTTIGFSGDIGDGEELDTFIPFDAILDDLGDPTPEEAIDHLASRMIGDSLEPPVRSILVDTVDGSVDEEDLAGLAWLIATSPDFQRH